MTKDEALKLALQFVEDSECGTADLEAHIKEALACKEWVELTMEDFTDILKLASEGRPLEIWELFKAVENKAREKNT